MSHIVTGTFWYMIMAWSIQWGTPYPCGSPPLPPNQNSDFWPQPPAHLTPTSIFHPKPPYPRPLNPQAPDPPVLPHHTGSVQNHYLNKSWFILCQLDTKQISVINEIHQFALKIINFEILFAKCWQFCPDLNVLTHCRLEMPYGDIYRSGSTLAHVMWHHQAITWTNVD